MKGKAEKIEFNREWDGPHGKIYYFNIEFTDEKGELITGQFSTNKKDQDKFIVGTEYEITIEVKTTSKGEYNKFDKATTDKNPKSVKGKGWKRDVSVRRSIIAQSTLDYAVAALNAIINTWPELKIQDKITKISQIGSIAGNMMKWVALNSSNNEQMEIICQSSLKKAVAVISIKSLSIKSTDDILKAAEEFKNLALSGIEKLSVLILE